MFNKKPMCEVCKKKEAISFSLECSWDEFQSDPKHYGVWKFTCECNENKEQRYILINKFFESPTETIDWMAHYHLKEFVNWDKFMDMIVRFRKEINGGK